MSCWPWWWTMPSGFSGHEEGAMRRVGFGFKADRFARGWGAFPMAAYRWPGLAPAGDLLLCCTTKKKARKRTPLSRPLRGFPPSGDAGRGLRKLALRAQTCEALFPPVITSSRHARGERKCRLPTVSANRSFRRGSVPPESPFRSAEQRSSRRGLPVRLSEPEGRVPHRPPAGSSAGQSAAGRPVRRVAFFAFFLGDARKKVARRGESRPMQRIYPESLAVKAPSLLSPGAMASPLPT